MELILNSQKRQYLKIALWLSISYFFLGLTEGSFFYFHNGVDTLLNFLFTLVCVGGSWLLFKSTPKWLPGFVESQGARRILMAILVVIGLLVFITLLNWFYIEVLWQERLGNTLFFSMVLPLATLLFTAWVIGYFVWLSYLNQDSGSKVLSFQVKKGRQSARKPIAEVLGFQVEHKLVFLIDFEGQRYHIDRPMSDLEEELLSQGFFRVNRQLLLQRAAIEAFATASNDRVSLRLHSAFDLEVQPMVSRYKAPAFRKWMAE